jgi:C1A family cysteine protease
MIIISRTKKVFWILIFIFIFGVNTGYEALATEAVTVESVVDYASLPSSFDLRSKMSIEVKDQGSTEACWTFSAFSSMETNLKLKYGTSPDFSESHMNYATSQSFYDATNSQGFNRTASSGGSEVIAMAYLTNGQGAVLEEEMPFDYSNKNISINDIQITPSYYVKGYETFPSIYKYKDSQGKTIYYDGTSKYYTDEEIQTIRNKIKNHIMNYGGILAYTVANSSESYSSKNVIDSTSYYCDNLNSTVDHAITIVGWDDNYSKDNFTGSSKPNNDGAYLILNSYSSNVFDNGYLWISYEDAWIESALVGITDSSVIDYDNIYQNNWYGANVPITLMPNGKTINEAYYASIYDRDSSKKNELLTEISVTTNQEAEFEVYVNPNGTNLNKSNLVKVATTDTLKSGYNTIQITPTLLTGDKFAVVVKQKTTDTMYIMIEAEVDNTFYDCISAEAGYSKVSLNGTSWYNLSSLGHIDYAGYDIDLAKADVCIKAFTSFDTITSEKYAISKDNYITKIYDDTTINEFLNNINILGNTFDLYTAKGEKITDYSQLAATGMTLKVNDITYTLAVRGDLNGDGKISLVDLSKHIAYFAEIEGFELTGAYDKASDINLDGKFSLIDVSQLLVIFTNM